MTYVKVDSDIGGSNPIYWNYSNFILIMHPNGEYSQCDHLSTIVQVKVGQYVKAGEEIAKVGMTGYTYCTASSLSGLCSYWN